MYDQDPITESDDECDLCELCAHCTMERAKIKINEGDTCFVPANEDGRLYYRQASGEEYSKGRSK